MQLFLGLFARGEAWIFGPRVANGCTKGYLALVQIGSLVRQKNLKASNKSIHIVRTRKKKSILMMRKN